MPRPEDAQLIAALECQYRALGSALSRIRQLRADIASSAVPSWRGAAQLAFTAGVHTVALSTEATEAVIQAAHGSTGAALARVELRV